MSMAIDQHFVPQFYLRAFATSKGGERIWVTHIRKAYAGEYEDRKKSVSDVAHQAHLYSLPREDGNFYPDRPNENGWDDSVDAVLQSIETDAGRLWQDLLKDPQKIDFSPGSAARITLATFLASLHLRSPRMVAVSKYAATAQKLAPFETEQERDEFHALVASTPVDHSATLDGIEDRFAFLAAQLTMLPEVGAVLHQLHWTLQIFPGNRSFGPVVTSDTPVICVDRQTMHATNMESGDAMVICPLTSRALLIATHTPATTLDGAVVVGTPHAAEAVNRFIVHFGRHEAYSGFQLGRDFPFLRDEPNI